MAEGVENQATLELLTELGVDQAQGYHLARPAPLPTFGLDQPARPHSVNRPVPHSPVTPHAPTKGSAIATIEHQLAITVDTERRRHGMTVKDLADAAQVHPATVRRLSPC